MGILLAQCNHHFMTWLFILTPVHLCRNTHLYLHSPNWKRLAGCSLPNLHSTQAGSFFLIMAEEPQTWSCSRLSACSAGWDGGVPVRVPSTTPACLHSTHPQPTNSVLTDMHFMILYCTSSLPSRIQPPGENREMNHWLHPHIHNCMPL